MVWGDGVPCGCELKIVNDIVTPELRHQKRRGIK